YAEIAAEFVRLKVDIIVTSATPPTLAAKQATAIIPIVFTLASDPIGTGLVASLARPGGNVTGLANQISDRHGGRQSVVLACRLDEVGELVRTGAHVVLVEHAFRKPAEEARHAVLQHLAARGQERRAGRNHLAERKEVGFVTAGSVQDQEGTRRGLRPRLETVDEREASHHAALSTPASGGSAASISARRTSRNGGSLRSRPSVATGSSTVKPGWSVAISNRMPPGSRK